MNKEYLFVLTLAYERLVFLECEREYMHMYMLTTRTQPTSTES